MSGQTMYYPDTWQDFADDFSLEDNQKVYTDGSVMMEMYRVQMMMEYYHDPVVEENDKLRGLCSKLLDIINVLCLQQRHCLECELNGQPLCKLAKLFHEAHELGIEVKK